MKLLLTLLLLSALAPRTWAQVSEYAAPLPVTDTLTTPGVDAASGEPSFAREFLVTVPPDSAGQPAPSPSRIRPWRLGVFSGGFVGGNVGLFMWERARWWSGERRSFHFKDQLDYAANLDKLSHLYVTDLQALFIARSLEWTGVRPATADLWGAGLALLMQTHVEFHDGFSGRWGFDRYDMLANVLGAGWFYAHERSSFLRRFDIRTAYFPSQLRDPMQWFDDDYDHFSFWLSTRLEGVLPAGARPYWPDYLCLSAGVSVSDWHHEDPLNGHAAYYLSVDLDFDELLPRRTLLGRTLADFLNRVHLPFPALRLYPEPGLLLFYYGPDG